MWIIAFVVLLQCDVPGRPRTQSNGQTKRRKTATETTTTDGTRYEPFETPFPFMWPYGPVAQHRRGVKKDARPAKIMVLETCEDLSARRVRVGLVYENVTAVR